MKAKHSVRVLIAVLGSLLTQLLYPAPAKCAPPYLTSDSPTNIQTTSTDTNIVNEVRSPYRTIVDQQLGQYAIVDTNKEVVMLKDKADKIVWAVNVADALRAVPISGERKIHNMQMIKGDLIVTFSRGFAKIDRKSGSVTWLGSD